jgi:hypothetical protein
LIMLLENANTCQQPVGKYLVCLDTAHVAVGERGSVHLLLTHPAVQNRANHAPRTTSQAAIPPSGAWPTGAVAETLLSDGGSLLGT